MMGNYLHILCHFAQGGEFLQFKAVAGFEPDANVDGTVYSVATARQLNHNGSYLADKN